MFEKCIQTNQSYLYFVNEILSAADWRVTKPEKNELNNHFEQNYKHYCVREAKSTIGIHLIHSLKHTNTSYLLDPSMVTVLQA